MRLVAAVSRKALVAGFGDRLIYPIRPMFPLPRLPPQRRFAASRMILDFGNCLARASVGLSSRRARRGAADAPEKEYKSGKNAFQKTRNGVSVYQFGFAG